MQQTLQHQATSNLTDPGLCSPYQCPCYRHKGELKAGKQPYLQQLGLHGRRDSGRVNELERRSSIVGVLCWERYQHLDTVVATMHRHCAAPVCSVHLQGTSPRWRQTPKDFQRKTHLPCHIVLYFICSAESQTRGLEQETSTPPPQPHP